MHALFSHQRFPADGISPQERYTFDAIILTDKLLVLPNQYQVLPTREHGALAIPPTLSSSGDIVLLLALSGSTEVAADMLQVQGHPCLKLLVRDSAKPGRQSSGAPDSITRDPLIPTLVSRFSRVMGGALDS